jgi:hypothetical protein
MRWGIFASLQATARNSNPPYGQRLDAEGHGKGQRTETEVGAWVGRGSRAWASHPASPLWLTIRGSCRLGRVLQSSAPPVERQPQYAVSKCRVPAAGWPLVFTGDPHAAIVSFSGVGCSNFFLPHTLCQKTFKPAKLGPSAPPPPTLRAPKKNIFGGPAIFAVESFLGVCFFLVCVAKNWAFFVQFLLHGDLDEFPFFLQNSSIIDCSDVNFNFYHHSYFSHFNFF